MALDAETVRQVKQLVEAYKQYVDDRIEDLVGQRIRRLEAERDAMSKPSVDVLVKTMLGPIEDRLRAVEGKTMRFDSPEAAAEWRKWRDRNSIVGGDRIIEFAELERLRRIEEAAKVLTNMPVYVQGKAAADALARLGEAVRS